MTRNLMKKQSSRCPDCGSFKKEGPCKVCAQGGRKTIPNKATRSRPLPLKGKS